MAEVEHNEESLLFLESCAEYKREPTAAAAAALTDKYIREGAPLQVMGCHVPLPHRHHLHHQHPTILPSSTIPPFR